jgi:predicted kinase
MTIPLTILIGLPGSGKTETARRWVMADSQRILIATDTIRAQLFQNEAVQGSWLLVWQEVERQFRQAVAQIKQGKASAALYDATNACYQQRQAVIALARQVGFTQITGLWLDTPLSVCLQRNQQRSRQVPEAVILQMHRQLTAAPPALADGLDDLIRL